MSVFTNSVGRNDFLANVLKDSSLCDQDIFIAVAFFTDAETVEYLCNQNNKINMVVRLGYPTSVNALKKLLKNQNVNIRFYTSSKFHPKLYIFTDFALVGSANLTQMALRINQEIVMKIDSVSPDFDDLQSIFSSYWAAAEPLSEKYIEKYAAFLKKYPHPNEDSLDWKVKDEVGDFEYRNITTTKKDTRTQTEKATSAFRKNYQDCRQAIMDLQKKYDATKIRKGNPDLLPVKLELDAFMSWVKDKKAPEDKWLDQIAPESRDLVLNGYFQEWRGADDRIVPWSQDSFQKISALFKSEYSLRSASYATIMDSLIGLYSFHSRQRFFKGGLNTLIDTFTTRNTEQKVKDTFSYLFFTKGDVIDKMYSAIYDNQYRLEQFSRSGVQELVGWVDKDLVVVNGRTTKVLHFLGYNVKQIDKQLD